ncbi:MAG: cell division protein ZapE, partial [Pusillimonas sp.]
GVYLWGGVGRGKSFLMDAFYATVPLKRKGRLHFHEFMRGVHHQLDEVKGQQDPLDEVARRIAKRYRLICFDEFHVSDVADAMILYRLLFRLFELGTSFVMTSNYEPSTLYPDGLHRDRILPAIKLIQERMDVLNVDTGTDYRRRALEQVRVYLSPLSADTRAELQQAFESLSDTAPMKPVLTVENRELKAVALSGSVVWFDFATLCGGPRSQNDYLDLASRFQTVILSEVPRMTVRQASEARRFTWLVDVFYDHKVKLIISAECEPEGLYTEGPMANEFHRTVSRLLEMQSREYLESERRVAATL